MSARTAGVVMLAVGAAVAAARGQAPVPSSPRVERPIVTTGQGPHRLPVDVPLLTGAHRFSSVRTIGSGDRAAVRAEGGLRDLRLFASDGREIGYLLVYPTSGAPEWMSGTIVPVAPVESQRRKTSGFEVDLGAVQPFDAVRFDGLPTPLLKPLALEGSGDRERWTLLASEATVFDLPQERLRHVTVPFTPGNYRYLRVTWDDTHSGRLPLPRAVVARRAGAPARAVATLTASIPFERRPSEPGTSRYLLRLPAAALPIVGLTLEVGGGHVYRTVTVSESWVTGSEAVPAEIGRATIARVTRDGATATQLRIPIWPPREAALALVIDDGNNPPLDLKAIVADFAELPWIYFEAPGGPIVARYGDRRATAPSYDLEAARDSIRIAEVPDASWGPARETTAPAPAPNTPMSDTGASIDVSGFRVQRTLPEGAPGLVALALDAAVLAGSRGPAARFADIRIVDASGRQVPYLVERREEPLALDLELKPYEAKAQELRSDSKRQRSVYSLRLPHANLPSVRIVLETSSRVFSRQVLVGVEGAPDRQRRNHWFENRASASWRHADESTAAPPLTLHVGNVSGTELLVVIDEWDNRPLPIAAARALLPSYRLRFFRPASDLRLVYGHDDLGTPQYDLELLAPQVMGAEVREIAAAPAGASPHTTFVPLLSPRTFWIGLGVAVIALLAIIARLVRT